MGIGLLPFDPINLIGILGVVTLLAVEELVEEILSISKINFYY
jgi:hypothetical protein